MITLKTQTPTYWQEEFTVTDQDVHFLRDLIIEHGEPVTIDDLAVSLIQTHCQREIQTVRHELHRGPLYQPKDSYQVGQTLIFPAMHFAAGTVVGTRPGYDPSHGEFEVIQVQFEGAGEEREFASRLPAAHVLNRPEGNDGLTFLDDLVSPDEIVREYGALVKEKVARRLQEEDAGFVHYQGRWLVREMLPEIHMGHLNIAEAAIDVEGRPLSPKELLPVLELPEEIPSAVKEFALNVALAGDERFDDVGWDGTVLWFLRRLEPAVIVNPPTRLRFIEEPFERNAILPELLALAKEIDHEISTETLVRSLDTVVYKTHVLLTYPHVRSGTLPLGPQLKAMLPQGTTQHTRIEFIDGRSGETMVGWVHHELGFVAGLEKWYADNNILPGAFVRIERMKKSGVLLVDFEQRRLRREWVRVVNVKDGRITFGMQKLPIACQYDEEMAVHHADEGQLDAFVEQIYAERRPLAALLREIVPELVKLNPSGTVHAKTIFAAVNLFRRTRSAPVFAVLSTEPAYVHVGNGLWAFQESRVS